MAVSVSVLLVLLILVVVFLRSGKLRVTHAVVCLLLGFSLSDTSLAPGIAETLSATASAVGALHP
ncbi:hypothetical protein GCM10027168_54090 [Streptomyces capparidis]